MRGSSLLRSSLREAPCIGQRLRLKRPYDNRDSSYGTDTDTPVSETSSGDRYACSPITPSTRGSSTTVSTLHGWQSSSTPRTIPDPRTQLPTYPSPWLSAVPRTGIHNQEQWKESYKFKRPRLDKVDVDEEYDGEESGNGSSSEKASERAGVRIEPRTPEADVAADKKAAWLLMHLSVRDQGSIRDVLEQETVLKRVGALEGPRVKRRRATSM